jgi:hypothetical protein
LLSFLEEINPDDSDEENDEPSAAKRSKLSDMNNPNWYTKLSQEVRQRIMFPGTDRNPAGSSGSTPSTMTSVGQIYLSSDPQVSCLSKFEHFKPIFGGCFLTLLKQAKFMG